ncbi:MAG: hypothetical protein KF855_11915 [Acidobacteria bacterium]|nr:hypothetical protein [Acidobacteriota bacterium]
MNVDLLTPEPQLEFANGGLCHDIRFGIGHFGTYDSTSEKPREIKLGIIGSNETIDSLTEWLDDCRGEIAAKKSNQPNLFPPFPGFAPEHSFRSRLTWDDSTLRAVHFSQKPATRRADFNKILEDTARLYTEEIAHILDKSDVSVIVCALPMEQLKATTAAYMASYLEDDLKSDSDAETQDDKDNKGQEVVQALYDFHDYLKAESLAFRVPIQIVLPATYDETKQAAQKKIFNRDQQDEATRAWNFHTALYYKARGVPWRMVRQPHDLTTCYLGISFFNTLDREKLYASSAQVFNERGEGIVVRGGIAYKDKDDRQVHLDEEGANTITSNALQKYFDEHNNYPARIVLHKTSSFTEQELFGFGKAFEEKGIKNIDYVHVRESHTKLFRTMSYPPLRGTLWQHEDKKGILYTKGSVPFYETYPGKYPPGTIYIDSTHAQRSFREIATEIFALTKMNWNSTRFDQKVPITLKASREVGDILKYVKNTDSLSIPPHYRFYM